MLLTEWFTGAGIRMITRGQFISNSKASVRGVLLTKVNAMFAL